MRGEREERERGEGRGVEGEGRGVEGVGAVVYECVCSVRPCAAVFIQCSVN